MNEGQKYFPPPPSWILRFIPMGDMGKISLHNDYAQVGNFFPPTNDYRDENATSMVVTPRKR